MQLVWGDGLGPKPVNVEKCVKIASRCSERRLWAAVRKLSLISPDELNGESFAEDLLALNNEEILFLCDVLSQDLVGYADNRTILTVLCWLSPCNSTSKARLFLAIFGSRGRGYLDDDEFCSLQTCLKNVLGSIIRGRYREYFQKHFRLPENPDPAGGCTLSQLVELFEHFFIVDSTSQDEASLRDDSELRKMFTEFYTRHQLNKLSVTS